jgi:hypothetical protein
MVVYDPVLHPVKPSCSKPAPEVKLPKMLVLKQGESLPFVPSCSGPYVLIAPYVYEHQRGHFKLIYHRQDLRWELRYALASDVYTIAQCSVDEDVATAIQLIVTHGDLTPDGRVPLAEQPSWEVNIGGLWTLARGRLEVVVPTKAEARWWTGRVVAGEDASLLTSGFNRFRCKMGLFQRTMALIVCVCVVRVRVCVCVCVCVYVWCLGA